MNFRAWRGVPIVVIAWSLGACADAGGEHPSVEAALRNFQAQPVDEVALEVNGRAISAEEWGAFQQHGVLPEAALEELMVRELLFEEAEKRGYHTHESLGLVRKKAMVQQLLAQEIEAPADAAALEATALKAAEDALRRKVGHPPGLQASHILVSVAPDKQKSASKEELDRWFAEAEALLATLRDELPDRPTIPQLYEVRDRYRGEISPPLEIHVNAHLIFPIAAYLEGQEGVVYGQALPSTWRAVVPEFGQAATDLARAGKFGQLSDPVRSGFGWHLLMAEKLYPAQLPDARQLGEVARAQLVRQRRHQRLVARMKEWMQAASVQTFPQVIAEAHDTQN